MKTYIHNLPEQKAHIRNREQVIVFRKFKTTSTKMVRASCFRQSSKYLSAVSVLAAKLCMKAAKSNMFPWSEFRNATATGDN